MVEVSITDANAAQSAFYAEVAARNNGDPRPDALPEWEDLDPQSRAEHREWCDSCEFCEAHRAWGTCHTCGYWPMEASDQGDSICCGSFLILDPADGGPTAVAA